MSRRNGKAFIYYLKGLEYGVKQTYESCPKGMPIEEYVRELALENFETPEIVEGYVNLYHFIDKHKDDKEFSDAWRYLLRVIEN